MGARRRRAGPLGPHTQRRRPPLGDNPQGLTWSEAKKLRRNVLRTFRGLARQLTADVKAIEDAQLQFTVGVLMEALADEDDCASIQLDESSDGTMQFKQVAFDKDLHAGLKANYGDRLEEAIRWLMTWLHDNPNPITWLGWAFGRVDIFGRVGERRRVHVGHVVYDFAERRTLGITLNDHADDLYKSALLPMESR